jgi:hypothetical protein
MIKSLILVTAILLVRNHAAPVSLTTPPSQDTKILCTSRQSSINDAIPPINSTQSIPGPGFSGAASTATPMGGTSGSDPTGRPVGQRHWWKPRFSGLSWTAGKRNDNNQSLCSLFLDLIKFRWRVDYCMPHPSKCHRGSRSLCCSSGKTLSHWLPDDLSEKLNVEYSELVLERSGSMKEARGVQQLMI